MRRTDVLVYLAILVFMVIVAVGSVINAMEGL